MNSAASGPTATSGSCHWYGLFEVRCPSLRSDCCGECPQGRRSCGSWTVREGKPRWRGSNSGKMRPAGDFEFQSSLTSLADGLKLI